MEDINSVVRKSKNIRTKVGFINNQAKKAKILINQDDSERLLKIAEGALTRFNLLKNRIKGLVLLKNTKKLDTKSNILNRGIETKPSFVHSSHNTNKERAR